MNARLAASFGAASALMGVALGAFGAHALKTRLEPRDLETFETAVRYQMYHAFALFAAAWLISREAPGASNAAIAFITGTVIFSGSLYILVFTGQRWLGAITPIGGVAFLTGWALMLMAARKLQG